MGMSSILVGFIILLFLLLINVILVKLLLECSGVLLHELLIGVEVVLEGSEVLQNWVIDFSTHNLLLKH